MEKNNMTAVELLEKKLKTYLSWSSFLEEDFEQAKEMEKKQIKDAIIHNQNGLLRRKTVLEAEEYYNQTYGK